MFNIPNLFTAFNLLSGTMAIILTLMGRIDLAPFAIYLGAIFDFFDGFLARKLKQSGEYESYDIFELCFISKKLNIKVKLSLDETKTLNELIESKKNEIKQIESSFIWLWITAANDTEQNNLVDRFIEKHYK